MNIEDMLYEEATLEEKYTENENLYAILDERARMSKVNQLDYKATEIFGMTMLPYIVLLLIGIISSMGSLTATLMTYFTLGSAAISLPIGFISSALINKKYKTKQRFKDFSNTKKESEKIELQLSNELQLEIIKNKNLVLEKTIEKIHSFKLNITDLSKYKDLNMSIIPKDLEKVLRDKQLIQKELEQKYKELYILSVKNYLVNNLGKYMLRGQSAIETFFNSFMYGIMPFLLLFIPVIVLAKQGVSIPSFLGKIELGMFGISVTSSTIYNLKKNKVQKNYFNTINELLGDEKFPKNKDNLHEEIEQINELINKKVLEISNIEFKKEECERSLETIGTREEVEKIIECYIKTFSKEKIEQQDTVIQKEIDYKENIYENLEKHEKQKIKTLKK